MPDADVVIAWAHGSVPNAARTAFSRPTKFVTLPNPSSWSQALQEYGFPNPVRGMVAKFAPGTTPVRVALLGFSASCQGVAQVLASGDGGRVDSVLAVDGIHVGYASSGGKRSLNAAGMKSWLEFGKLAVVNERLFVVSHSSVVPPNYASTTETADYLWDTLTGGSPAFAVPPLPDLSWPPTSVTTSVNGPTRTVQYPSPPWNEQKRAGGLIVLGCENLDKPSGTADHVYQAKVVIPLTVTELLAARWNGMDPGAPEQACYIS